MLAGAMYRLFQQDIQEAARLLQDPNALKGAIRRILEKHASAAEPLTTVAEDAFRGIERSAVLHINKALKAF